MSTAILPDDSVVVRMPTHTVHVDATARAIHVREPSHHSHLGGLIRASFPLESADRIRLMTARTGKQHLCLDLCSGETLDLGEVPSREVAMVTARAIADLTRCKIEVAEGTVNQLPGPSRRFTEGVTFAASEQRGNTDRSRSSRMEVPRDAHGAERERSAGSPPRPKPSVAISPEHAEQMFQVIEALMDSQDDLQSIPEEGAQDLGHPDEAESRSLDNRTVEMTRQETEQAMARSRKKSIQPAIVPLEEDESDRPTFTPRSSSRLLDDERSTDREAAIEDDLGVDGLAATIADARIDDLILDAPRRRWSSSRDEDSSASTQPDRPVQQDVFDEFVEETQLDSDIVKTREPVFQQLLFESQFEAAMSPVAGDRSTDLHVAASPNQTRREAIIEMLRATVESLPEATSSMPEE